MAKVELKQPIVQEISETIKDAQSLVVVDYRGLTVAEDTQLRKNLREAGVTYKVYKNTLVNRAIEGTEFESLKDVLEGPNAFAVSTEDATAPARVLAEFAKKAPSLEIKAGVVEGTYYDAEGMKQIASVPSREVLLSKLLGSLQSPITNLARVLNQIAEKGGAADAAAWKFSHARPPDTARQPSAKRAGGHRLGRSGHRRRAADGGHAKRRANGLPTVPTRVSSPIYAAAGICPAASTAVSSAVPAAVSADAAGKPQPLDSADAAAALPTVAAKFSTAGAAHAEFSTTSSSNDVS